MNYVSCALLKFFLPFSINVIVLDFNEYLSSQTLYRVLLIHRVTDVTGKVLIDSANFLRNSSLTKAPINLVFPVKKKIYIC